MSKNPGKRFEEDFANSVPSSYCMLHRLKDSAQAYNNSRKTSFAWDNPCDFFLFNSKSHLFYAFECKTTKFKSMSVQIEKDDSNSSMVKNHQIKSLKKMAEYDGVIAGFLFNFRHFEDEKDKCFESTYFQNVEDFLNMMSSIGKKSFNELDLLGVGNAIRISGEKKRTRYKWNFEEFFNSQIETISMNKVKV